MRLTASVAQVPKDKAAGVAAVVSASTFNRALASSGISVGTISSISLDHAPDTVHVPASFAPVADASVDGLDAALAAGIGAVVLVWIVISGVALPHTSLSPSLRGHSTRASEQVLESTIGAAPEGSTESSTRTLYASPSPW